MLALSGAVHLLLAIAALALPTLFRNPMRLEPVAVVDLIGGGDFRREAASPPAPAAREPVKPEPRGRKDSTPPPAKRGKGAKAAAGFAESKRQAADTASLAERLRKMKEARAGSEAVRGAVEERRSEAAARAAVRGVKERVAHRINAPVPARSGVRGAAAGAGGGSQGTVRVSPEMTAYYDRLKEIVRNSWIPPGHVRDVTRLEVQLVIMIEKNGRVSDTRIEKGSGNIYFDDSVLRAIRKASPLPVPPEQLRGGEDHYGVGFIFRVSGEMG
jgi:TonB family protein